MFFLCYDHGMKMSYLQALEFVSTLQDGAGQKVDPEMTEIVASLVMHGFLTDSSCQGHPERDDRCAPFVVLCAESPGDEWEEKAREEWYLKNIEQQKRLASCLAHFYESHSPIDFYTRLVINSFGAGVAELKSYGAEFIELEENKVDVHRKYLQEMKSFSTFLRNL